MKSLFPQYTDQHGHDFPKIWDEALFVFDTNVLLNLYRYQAHTREELVKLLEQLSPRVWIPHHVALEFQRNRITVIAEQLKKFSEVRHAVEKNRANLAADIEKLQLNKRHSSINPHPLLLGIDKIAREFIEALNNQQQSQQKLTGPDILKTRLEQIFSDKVGAAPKNQNEIDELYKEADLRFKRQIPPGYRDNHKEKDGGAEYMQGGIVYQKKYGDFLVWRQMLSHAHASKLKAMIFVTDDNKDDWWLRVEMDGPKIIGPRPELIEEAKHAGGLDTFLMYAPDSFLKFAQELRKTTVSNETVEEVQEVSSLFRDRLSKFRKFIDERRGATQAIRAWLLSNYEMVQEPSRGNPDFIARNGKHTIYFDIIRGSNPKQIARNVISGLLFHHSNQSIFDDEHENGFICLATSAEEGHAIKENLIHQPIKERVACKVMIGTLAGTEPEQEEIFIPLDEFSIGSSI